MGENVKLAFIVQKPQYKGETSRLGITHAISYQTVEILLEDGELVTPTLCFVGEGVLGLQKGQKAMDMYGVTSSETHIKNALLVDLDVFICKEDLAKYGIPKIRCPMQRKWALIRNYRLCLILKYKRLLKNQST